MRDQSKKIDPPFTSEHAASMCKELIVVPPCRECGKVPKKGYRRFGEGGTEVQCLRCEQ